MSFQEIEGATLCFFKAGEYLIHAGEVIAYVYYLQSGTVYRQVTSEAGNESILSRRSSNNGPASVVGLLAIYHADGKQPSNSDFIAQTDCVCYRIPSDACRAYLRAHPKLLEETLRLAMNEFSQMGNRFMARCDKTATSQFCAFLLQHARETDNGWYLPKHYTNVEIAKFLSLHKVTIANMIRALKEQGVIERTSQGLHILDMGRLQDYASHRKMLNYKK